VTRRLTAICGQPLHDHHIVGLAMTRISITPEAFEAIVATLPLGSVGYEPELNSKGERRIWIEAAVADRPSLTCLVVTKASPWGHTCGDFATRLAFGLVGDFASRWNGGRSSGGLIGTCRHLVGIAVTTPTGRKEPRHALGRG